MIDRAIRQLIEGQNLSRAEMHQVFAQMMDGGASDVQKSALLVALRMKGETAEEITGAAMAMRERVYRLDTGEQDVVDTCGTGGDGKGSFNVSTVAAIVCAGAGATVAKHGNRAVSSSCGSADVLAALGVSLDIDPSHLAEVLRRVGIVFLFAPRLHPATGAVAAVRRELGVRTIFNLLGPLTNPALARRQVIGVYAPYLVRTIAEVLAALGARHALVVHSRDGMDEISVSATTDVCEVRDGKLSAFSIDPRDLGLSSWSIDEVKGGDAAANAQITRELLGGVREGAMLEIVAANAGAALYVAGLASSLSAGVAMALEAVASGAALRKLDDLVAVTRELGQVTG
jgi:anthranilate phosphoribosyltransferase